MKPTNNRVLVELEKTPEHQGSIILPEFLHKDHPLAATIIAIGRDCKELQTGQRVLVPNYGGLPVEKDGKHYKLFTQEEVFGILEENAEVNVV